MTARLTRPYGTVVRVLCGFSISQEIDNADAPITGCITIKDAGGLLEIVGD